MLSPLEDPHPTHRSSIGLFTGDYAISSCMVVLQNHMHDGPLTMIVRVITPVPLL